MDSYLIYQYINTRMNIARRVDIYIIKLYTFVQENV